MEKNDNSGGLKKFLATTVKEFEPNPKPLISVDVSDNARHLSSVLSQGEIYSVVVEDKQNHKYLGLLDFGDIVSFIVSSFYEKIGQTGTTKEERLTNLLNASFIKDKQDSKKRKSVDERKSVDLQFFSDLHHNFEKQQAATLVNFSKKNTFITLKEDADLNVIVQAFASGIQRVPIVDASGKIIHYLTQSGVVKYLAKNISHLEPFIHQQVGSLGFEHKHVVEISESSFALEAFAKMHEYGISGLPLLDSAGHFVGAISARDIKYALSDFTRFLLPVHDFVVAIRNQSTYETNPTIYCKLTDPLSDVIRKLIAVKIHRLFVIEDTKKFIPVGVISHQDILTALLKHHH
eukprot:TRINITY_DN5364_c0_g1_i1.p1 TRINITY_DN5364_c0_g1~~TRINITY_DN5364_c0_g1_i1.p1  ORF type:complete len:348 (-),score=106.84 TRINITY_DN5364_c0_g1_i1:114-1157(-)